MRKKWKEKARKEGDERGKGKREEMGAKTRKGVGKERGEEREEE